MSRLAHCVIAFLLLSLSAQAATYYECLVLAGTNGGYASLVDPGKATVPYYVAYRADLSSGPWANFKIRAAYTNTLTQWGAFPSNYYETFGASAPVATQADFAVWIPNDVQGTNNGSVSGAIWTNAPVDSMWFDHIDDTVDYSDVCEVGPMTTSVSVALWAKFQNDGTLCGRTETGGAFFQWFLYTYGHNGKLRWACYNSSFMYCDTPGTYSTNTWYFIAATRDPAYQRLYVDGAMAVQSNSIAGLFNPAYSSAFLQLGKFKGGQLPYGGWLSDFMVFTNAVDSSMVTNLYNDSCAKYGKSPL